MTFGLENRMLCSIVRAWEVAVDGVGPTDLRPRSWLLWSEREAPAGRGVLIPATSLWEIAVIAQDLRLKLRERAEHWCHDLV